MMLFSENIRSLPLLFIEMPSMSVGEQHEGDDEAGGG